MSVYGRVAFKLILPNFFCEPKKFLKNILKVIAKL